MKEISVESKTVAQAIEDGLKQLGMRRDQVEVTVVQEPSAGILGFGAKPAKVLLREKRWGHEEPRAESEESFEEASRPEPGNEAAPRESARPPKGPGGARRPRNGSDRAPRPRREFRERPPRERRAAPVRESEPPPSGPYVPDVPKAQTKDSDEVKSVLGELLKLMALEQAEVLSGWDEAQGRVRAEISGAGVRVLLERDGSGLEALQFLTTLVVNRRLKAQVPVQVDVEGFFKRKEQRILGEALKAVDEVKRNGRTYRLEPMDAPLRRLVHKALSENPDVETVSEGEGAFRKVTIRPRRK